jgi:hypothetical protein
MKTKSEYQYILQWNKKIKAINLLGSKCEKCDENRPWVLSFHHKNPEEKEFTINNKNSLRWSIIEKEVIKCQLLCERCHRELHFDNTKTFYTESKKILLDIKLVSGCELCGYNDCNKSLDFHHKKDKDFDVGHVRIFENSCKEVKEKILNEINKCIVLCTNCHKDLHFDKEKFNKYKEEIYNWKYIETKKPLDEKLVMKLYNKGIKQIDIAKKFNRNKTVINGIIKRYLMRN